MTRISKTILLIVAFLLFDSRIVFARVLVSFADVTAQAKKGVVNIRTTTLVRGRLPRLDPYQFFFNERLPTVTKTQSLGSGVIMKDKGYILTNYHVIENATSVQIHFADNKRKVLASIVGTDPKTDLALLKVKLPRGYRAMDLGNSDKLRVGDIVLAIGNPFGYAHTVTSGIISAKGRVIGTGPYDNFLQTDAPIHPGNSGGPLIDVRGRVVGINSAVASNAYGIGFAIPINIAKKVASQLIKHGNVIRPWLGVVGKNILSADEIGDQYDPAGVYGVIVANLIIDGPAHKSGLKMSDLVTGLNKSKVRDMNHLHRLLADKRPGERVRLKIYRRGRGFIYLSVNLGTTPKANELPAEKDLL